MEHMDGGLTFAAKHYYRIVALQGGITSALVFAVPLNVHAPLPRLAPRGTS